MLAILANVFSVVLSMQYGTLQLQAKIHTVPDQLVDSPATPFFLCCVVLTEEKQITPQTWNLHVAEK